MLPPRTFPVCISISGTRCSIRRSTRRQLKPMARFPQGIPWPAPFAGTSLLRGSAWQMESNHCFQPTPRMFHVFVTQPQRGAAEANR
jgi:hypothetical protein